METSRSRRATDEPKAGKVTSILAKRKKMNKVVLTVKDKISFARMAEIKTEMTSLKMEYDRLFDALDAEGKLIPRVKTAHGEMALDSKRNWSVVNMALVFISLGKAKFLKHCSISRTGIVDVVGEDGFDKLKNVGGITLTSTSKYYRMLKKG